MSIKDFAEKWIAAYVEALKTGNCDALGKLEDANVVHHSVARGQDSIVGWAAHKQAITNMLQAVPDYTADFKYLTGEGSHFVMSYKAKGTLTGTAPGYSPPTGKEVTLDYLYVYRVHDGKVVEVWYKGSTTGFK